MIALAWAFLKGVSLRTWLLIGGVVAVVVLGLALRAHWIGVGEDLVQARWDAQEAVYARQRAEAITAARVLEERHRAELKAVADRFQAEQRKADEDHDRVVAGLRAGTVRVRERFTCPRVSGASADTRRADAEAPRGLGTEDAAAILGTGRTADRCAEQLNALIDLLEREGR